VRYCHCAPCRTTPTCWLPLRPHASPYMEKAQPNKPIPTGMVFNWHHLTLTQPASASSTVCRAPSHARSPLLSPGHARLYKSPPPTPHTFCPPSHRCWALIFPPSWPPWTGCLTVVLLPRACSVGAHLSVKSTRRVKDATSAMISSPVALAT
jgi:hypothetical protein